MKVIYSIGSLRNPEIPKLGNYLRKAGFEVFDDWYAAGPVADDSWQEYETKCGTHYKDALNGYAAKHVFSFDKLHLDRCDIGLLVLPAGKSGHLELGYLAGKGKPTYVLFEEEPERWDVMYQFANAVFFKKEDLKHELVSKFISTGASNGDGTRVLGLGEQSREDCPNAFRAVRVLGGGKETLYG